MKKVSDVSNLPKELPFTDVFPWGWGVDEGSTLMSVIDYEYVLAQSIS